MSVKVTQLIQDTTYRIRNRKRLKDFYHHVQTAIAIGDLERNGTPEQMPLNDMVKKTLGEEHIFTKGGNETVYDFVIKDDEKLEEFKRSWRGAITVVPSQVRDPLTVIKGKTTEPLFHVMQEAYQVAQNEMATKSELQETLHKVLDTYLASRNVLKAPPILDSEGQSLPPPSEPRSYMKYDREMVTYVSDKGFAKAH